MKNGHFVISLDFELFWGVRDSREFDSYKENIIGVRKAIPAMLELFEEFNIKATFATVGFLFAKDKKDLLNHVPVELPSYENAKLSPYPNYLSAIGENEGVDPYHLGRSLIEQIHSKKHEIGCHTFCHYYCLEKGQTISQFEADLLACRKLADEMNVELKSFVFPRNQYNPQYLEICSRHGITSYRGNEKSWLYKAKNRESESMFRRAIRLMDAYLNISGHHCYSEEDMKSSTPLNIPSSRFLRPFNSKLKFLDGLKLKRIKKGMTHAAKHKLVYHLWWHPHNFGINTNENINFLRKVLQHFSSLKNEHNFESITINGVAEKLNQHGK